MLTIVAFVAFVVAAIWYVITRSWPFALVAGGLALWVLADTGPIRIGG